MYFNFTLFLLYRREEEERIEEGNVRLKQKYSDLVVKLNPLVQSPFPSKKPDFKTQTNNRQLKRAKTDVCSFANQLSADS